MIVQLNPTIPVVTPKGKGYALFVQDMGQEHHLYWTVALDANGQIWTFKNPLVRVQDCITMDRPEVEQP